MRSKITYNYLRQQSSCGRDCNLLILLLVVNEDLHYRFHCSYKSSRCDVFEIAILVL